jgi:hypothetical protein
MLIRQSILDVHELVLASLQPIPQFHSSGEVLIYRTDLKFRFLDLTLRDVRIGSRDLLREFCHELGGAT